MQCSSCSAEVPDDDIYCEVCGLRLDSRHTPPARDDGAREEFVLSPSCAAITDRGLKRARNEDRFAIRQAGTGWVLVVCDGVSSSEDSQRASLLASERTADHLVEPEQSDPAEAVRKAIADAGHAASELPRNETASEPASTTIVAALAAQDRITIGWLGDSRAYWIDADGAARQITQDHSWLNETVTAGTLSAEEAGKSPNAHSITKWLGADAEDMLADIADLPAPGPGTLLLCTDGLWNYAQEPSQIGGLVQAGGDAVAVARRLVDFALAGGGHDNVTVAVLQYLNMDLESNGERIQS